MVAAFVVPANQNSLLSSPVLRQNTDQATPLQMAFDKTEPSNMFEGPLPLVKERDACGVGFIANTKAGGTCSVDINNCRGSFELVPGGSITSFRGLEKQITVSALSDFPFLLL